MAVQNPRWGAERIRGELLKLGIRVSKRTVQRYMPSLAVDRAGNMALGYSASSSALMPAIRYAGRLAADPVSTLPQTEASLVEGTGAQNTSNRWGDYSATVLDPNNPYSFWTFQEFVAADRIYDGSASLADNNWAIQVTQIIVPEPGTWALFFVGAVGVLLFRRRTGGSPGRKSGAATESFPL